MLPPVPATDTKNAPPKIVTPAPAGRSARDPLSILPERFIALTVHEMQVPITTLSWNLDRLTRTLGDTATTAEVEKILRRIREANLRLVALVEDMMNLAKLQEGAFVVARRPVQLTEVVRRALRQVETEAFRRSVAVGWAAEPRIVPLTLGDPERLSQVVANLLGNSVKYTPRGGEVRVSLRVTTERAPPTVILERPPREASAYVLCTIEDTGIGIPRDEHPYVFQQFFRGRKAVASNESGTGLGLFLVKTIIEQHDGAVWFTSREGYGTTFYFTIPIMHPYDRPTTVGAAR